MRRAAIKHWIFEYYYGEYDQELGFTGNTESTREFTVDNLLSLTEISDLISDPAISVELKVYIPHVENGKLYWDHMNILHAEIGDLSFCDGTKVPSKIIRYWTKLDLV